MEERICGKDEFSAWSEREKDGDSGDDELMNGHSFNILHMEGTAGEPG